MIRKNIERSERDLTQNELSFDYSKVNPMYHAHSNPGEVLTLYKGSYKSHFFDGLPSVALIHKVEGEVLRAKDLIESEDEEMIRRLFKEHTCEYRNSGGLLSTTLNPELAQSFATEFTKAKSSLHTIYQIKVPAKRCVFDYHDFGDCGSNRELFVLGKIFLNEISAIKIDNDTKGSELRTPSGRFRFDRADGNSTNTAVKDPSNWRYFPNGEYQGC